MWAELNNRLSDRPWMAGLGRLATDGATFPKLNTGRTRLSAASGAGCISDATMSRVGPAERPTWASNTVANAGTWRCRLDRSGAGLRRAAPNKAQRRGRSVAGEASGAG